VAQFSRIPYYYRHQFSANLFGARSLSNYWGDNIQGTRTLESGRKRIYLHRDQVIIPPFYIVKYGLKYINPEELAIDLDELQPGSYTVLAVHNFQVEDRNPNLDECLAGVFFARQDAGEIVNPEEFPVECRMIEILGYLDTRKKQVYDYQ
jgi:hypothetical protein